MTQQIATTPFGRRPATLGQIAARMQIRQAIDAASQPGSNAPVAVNKWALYRTLTEIKERLGLSDRSLSVLNALLSFQQETALSLPTASSQGQERAGEGASCDLVVFPSNKALCLRAHGMAEATLRRHLAALVSAALIARRDSPNGKRYARRDKNGRERFSDAFGFDLTPLVARAAEFEAIAEALRAERREMQALKERISLHRRDIAKLIGCGVDEGVEASWPDYTRRLAALLTPVRQIRAHQAAAEIETQLATLRADVTKLLENFAIQQNMNGNDDQFDRHQSNSNTQSTSLEPASNEAWGEIPSSSGQQELASLAPVPLRLVLEACPDVRLWPFAREPVENWPGLVEWAEAVRPMLGISRDAWRQAVEALGLRDSSIMIAAILQRSEHSSEAKPVPHGGGGAVAVNGSPAIRSPGGYLRALTEQARAGTFSVWPLLMALTNQRPKLQRGRQDRSDADAREPVIPEPRD